MEKPREIKIINDKKQCGINTVSNLTCKNCDCFIFTSDGKKCVNCQNYINAI